MTTREIQGHLEEMYQVEVSQAFISTVTEGVQGGVKELQNRPLDAVYPILYIGRYDCSKNHSRTMVSTNMVSTNMDALYVKMRDNGQVKNRALFVAIGVNMEGNKDVLGLWVADSEGAKFWLDQWRRRKPTLSGDKPGRAASPLVSSDGSEDPRSERRLHRLRGRAERISGGD
jgi:putative transposase